MHVNTMRRLDFWIGIPFCFSLSCINAVQRFIFSRPKSQSTTHKKILFIELSEMGSAILGYPAIKETKDKHPDAQLYFLIFKQNEESVHILSIIPKENVFTIRTGNIFIFLWDTLKSIFKIRKEKIDVVVDMELFSRATSILSYLSGAKKRAGFFKFLEEGLYRGNLHTHKIVYNPHMHISKNFMSLVYALEEHDKEADLFKKQVNESAINLPKIETSADDKSKIFEKLKEQSKDINNDSKIAIISPGCSELLPLRQWPLIFYAELARKILEDKSIFVVLIGTESDDQINSDLCGKLQNNRCINLTGQLTLKELVDAYNISDVIIAHDSGPPNFASLTDIGIVVLFGPETPLLYAPISDRKTVLYANFACSPCVSAYNNRQSPCKKNKCLEAISVDEVYEATLKYLK